MTGLRAGEETTETELDCRDEGESMRIKLPEPCLSGSVSIEEALKARRSIREYSKTALTVSEVAQLLWSAYGVTSPEGFRTAPSAMALYPLEFYLNVSLVEGLSPGVYQYIPVGHELKRVADASKRDELFSSSFEQTALAEAPVILVITGSYGRMKMKFGESGPDYVHMDLGHAAQNIHLQAVSLSLGTVVIAAFRRNEVSGILRLPEDETPLYMMPIGRLHD